MFNDRVTVIGSGNMGTSLVAGLISTGFTSSHVTISDPDKSKLLALQKKFHVNISTDNTEAANTADCIILAVKPQEMRSVATALAPLVQMKKPLLISIAAGIHESQLQRWLGGNIAIVRCMPNMPALIRCGASALYANTFVSSEQRKQAESILSAISSIVWLEEESQMDAVTALSGSGPAYVFLLIEMLQEAGKTMGLSEDIAGKLTRQTVYGAARMVLESTESAKALRIKVTSPGGTTEAAIHQLEQNKIRDIVTHALQAAKKRSEELAQLVEEETKSS